MSDLVERIVRALRSSIDEERLRAALPDLDKPRAAPAPTSGAVSGPSGAAALERLALSDVLDEGILEARPGDSAFPLRVLLGDASAKLASSEAAFAFLSGINFYFRSECDSEAKAALAFEVSRAFYRFGKEIDRSIVQQAAPLLARIVSSQLSLVVLEDIETARVFDSSTHERTPESDLRASAIVSAESFLCRVRASGLVKRKAQVRT